MLKINKIFAGVLLCQCAQGWLHCMDFASCSAKPSQVAHEITDTCGRVIGRYYYSAHVIGRVAERMLKPKDINWVIGHGDRHKALRGTHFIMHPRRRVGVYFDPQTNTVITALGRIGHYGTKNWLAKVKAHYAKEVQKELAKQHTLKKRHPKKSKGISKKAMRVSLYVEPDIVCSKPFRPASEVLADYDFC